MKEEQKHRKSRIIATPRFIVNKENGTVTCLLKVNMQLRRTILYDSFCHARAIHKYGVNLYGGTEVVGVAKCNPEDTFDEVKGKRIAEARAKAKAFKLAKNVYTAYLQAANRGIKEIELLRDNCAYLAEKEVEHLKEVM